MATDRIREAFENAKSQGRIALLPYVTVGFPELGHTTDGQTMGIETHVLIDSDEPQDRIIALLNEAENACMAHHALRNPIPWQTRLVYNGEEVINRAG